MIEKVTQLSRKIICVLECGAPIADLALRLWIANVFWKSGLTKIQNYDTTLFLFESEYSVPLLSPEFAAFSGTAAELILPVLLVFGIAGRAAAGALFMVNLVAVISYPALNAAGLQDHQLWGIILLILTLRGPGRISVDHFIRKHFMGKNGCC